MARATRVGTGGRDLLGHGNEIRHIEVAGFMVGGRAQEYLRRLLALVGTPERVAFAFAVGVFLAFSPLLGLHAILGLTIAFAFGLNRAAVLIGVFVSNPWSPSIPRAPTSDGSSSDSRLRPLRRISAGTIFGQLRSGGVFSRTRPS